MSQETTAQVQYFLDRSSQVGNMSNMSLQEKSTTVQYFFAKSISSGFVFRDVDQFHNHCLVSAIADAKNKNQKALGENNPSVTETLNSDGDNHFQLF